MLASHELFREQLVETQTVLRFDGGVASSTGYHPMHGIVFTHWADYSGPEDIRVAFEQRLALFEAHPEAKRELHSAETAFGPLAEVLPWIQEHYMPVLAARPGMHSAVIAPQALSTRLEVNVYAEWLRKLQVPIRLLDTWGPELNQALDL